MKLSFRETAIIGSRIGLALAAAWMGAPQFMQWVGQIDGSLSTLPVARLVLGVR